MISESMGKRTRNVRLSHGHLMKGPDGNRSLLTNLRPIFSPVKNCAIAKNEPVRHEDLSNNRVFATKPYRLSERISVCIVLR